MPPLVLERLNLGETPGNRRGTDLRPGGAAINRNAALIEAAVNALSGLNIVAGPVTKLAPGANPTANLAGSAPNYTLNLGLPEGAAGAGAPNSADILAIAEKDRLERALAAAGVPDEPSLILDFVRGVHFASKSAITSSILTLIAALGGVSGFARASTATYWDKDGLLKTAANNVPRLEYDPVTRLPRGLLVESQARTNWFSHSNAFGDAAWVKVGCTIVENDVIGPDGAASMDKLVEGASTGIHYIAQGTSSNSGEILTQSIFAKEAAGNASQRYLAIVLPYEAFGGGAYAVFDLATGAVTNIGGSAVAGISYCGGGIWKCGLTATATATASGIAQFRIQSSPVGLPNSSGDGTSSIHIFGSQYEVGVGPSSYIPTGPSAVTRATETVLLGGGAWLPSTAPLSLLTEFRLNERTPSSTSNPVYLMNVAATNVLGMREGAVLSNGADFVAAGAGAQQIDSGEYPTALTSPMRFAFGLDATSWAFAKDNVVSWTGGATTAPTGLDRVYLGINNFMGHIRRIIVYPQRLSNTKVQALSNQAAWS